MPSIELVDRHDQRSRGRYFRGADDASSSASAANGSAGGGDADSVGPTIVKIPGLGKSLSGEGSGGAGGSRGPSRASPKASAVGTKLGRMLRRDIGGPSSANKQDLIFSIEDGGSTSPSGAGSGRRDGASGLNCYDYGDEDELPISVHATIGRAAAAAVGVDDDYVGLERELEMRLRRRSQRKALFCVCFTAALVAGVVVHMNREQRGKGDAAHGGAASVEGRGSGGGGGGGGSVTVGGKISVSNLTSASGPTPSPTVLYTDVDIDNDDGMYDMDEIISLWPTPSPGLPFPICAPPLTPDRPVDTSSVSPNTPILPVFHISTIVTIPESPSTGDDENEVDDSWSYTFSAMDISDDASIVAVGLSDFSAGTDWSVGMVRTYGWNCDTSAWTKLGQDLRGSNQFEQFGHAVSSSEDGKVMAISAPQEECEDGKRGFVAVYYLDEDANRWEMLGDRIDELTDADGRIGHAIDLSDRGDTLAVLGVSGSNSYTIRMFTYDPDESLWKMKGHDLSITVQYPDSYDFTPQLSLSDDGDELSVSDPEFGVVRYHYHFAINRWERQGSRTVAFDDDTDNDGTGDADEDSFYLETVDVDDSGDVIAFAAFEYREASGVDSNGDQFDYDSDVESVKVVDFSNGTAEVVYASKYTDLTVGISVAVSDSGRVVAIVASKEHFDDDYNWLDYDYVGALTVLTKEKRRIADFGEKDDKGDKEKRRKEKVWGILGNGTKAEGMGVPGNFVTLSGDGRILAVGSANVVALYGIELGDDFDDDDGDGDDSAANEGVDANGATEEAILDGHGTLSSPPTKGEGPFDICPPFPDGDIASHVGDIDSLPKQADQHTLSVASSSDGSVVAVGIDSFDGEDRGMARVFGWSCDEGRYLQMGQDLLGTEEFDGFGQSVALSADGRTLVVGANQPPPGKSGYVEIYSYDDGGAVWSIVGNRLDGFDSRVGDIGREVKISEDGTVVAFSGSIVVTSIYSYDSSFVRVVEREGGGGTTTANIWTSKGSDLIGSIEYDAYGSEAHISLSGDGSTLAVVGSYDEFLVKVYAFDGTKKNWTEHIVIPPKDVEKITVDVVDDYPGDDDEDYEDENYDDTYGCLEEWDVYYDFFTGKDVALNADGTVIAVAGTTYQVSEEGAVVRVLRRNETSGNWTISPDPIDYTDDYIPNSVDLSGDGLNLAVGINSHTDGFSDQGALFVTTLLEIELDGKTLNWNSTGKVDGRNEDDLLGSRVFVTRDGTLAAASSRKGYVSFFKIGS